MGRWAGVLGRLHRILLGGGEYVGFQAPGRIAGGGDGRGYIGNPDASLEVGRRGYCTEIWEERLSPEGGIFLK